MLNSMCRSDLDSQDPILDGVFQENIYQKFILKMCAILHQTLSRVPKPRAFYERKKIPAMEHDIVIK